MVDLVSFCAGHVLFEGLQQVLRDQGIFITHTFVWINGSIVIPSRTYEMSQIDQVGAGYPCAMSA